jgi:O-methyltransferase
MPPIDPLNVWFRQAAACARADGGALALDTGEGKAVRIREGGLAIWEALEYPTTLARLAGALAVEFDGNREAVAADSASFVEGLEKAGLVERQGAPPDAAAVLRQRHLWLLKRALVNLIYPELELCVSLLDAPPSTLTGADRERALRDIRYRQPARFRDLVFARKHGSIQDKGWSGRFVHTLIGLTGLNHLERIAERIFADGIEGDFLEAGVCAGGAAIFMRALQVTHGEERRATWAADSFQGLPKPTSPADVAAKLDLTEARMPWVAYSLEAVRDNFIRYGLLDPGVRFLAGWFRDTLPTAPVGKLALLRIDADLYSSTREALDALYDKVIPGGFVVIDDYGIIGPCRQAVDEFRAERGIAAPLRRANACIVSWRKESA